MTAASLTSPIPIPRGQANATRNRNPPAASAAIARAPKLPGSVAATIATATRLPARSTTFGITRRWRSVSVTITSSAQKARPSASCPPSVVRMQLRLTTLGSRCVPPFGGWTRCIGGSGVELDRHDLDLELACAADHPRRQRAADRFGDHQALKLSDVRHRTSVRLDDQILGTQARLVGRAPLHHLDHLDRRSALLAGKARRQRPRPADDPDEGPANAPLA